MAVLDFYLLPGATRMDDRIIPALHVGLENYCLQIEPLNEKNGPDYIPDAWIVTVMGEDAKVYPFVLPCHFNSEWHSLNDYGKHVGKIVMAGAPFLPGSVFLSRSPVSTYIVLTDGSVHLVRAPGTGPHAFSQQLPTSVTISSIETMLSRSVFPEDDLPLPCA